MTIGFNLLKRDKRLLLSNNLFSTPCILSNGTETQGKNSLLPTIDPNYNKTDTLRCLGDFVGIQLNGNGIAVMNDSCETALNTDDITMGKPQKDWTLSFIQGGTNEMVDFRIDHVMEDRTAGIYRLRLSLLKKTNQNSQATSNQNTSNQTAKNQITFKRNRGI